MGGGGGGWMRKVRLNNGRERKKGTKKITMDQQLKYVLTELTIC